MKYVPKLWKGLVVVHVSPRIGMHGNTNLAKRSQHGEEEFWRIRWCEGIQEKARAVFEIGT